MATSSRRPRKRRSPKARSRDRRSPESRIPDLASLAAPLKRLAEARRSAPLLYIEFTGLGAVPARRRARVMAACKRAVASSLRDAVGTVLRRSDAVAAGAQAHWFVSLLVGRAVAERARASVDDADLGLISSRLQAAIRARLRELAGSGEIPSGIGVIGGWTVLDPVDPQRPLVELRQAVRGAAVVARVEAQRATVLAAVTHELRTPLTAIIGYAERLRDEQSLSPGLQARYSSVVAEEGRRLHRLVESLIDIGAWNAGRLKLAPRASQLRPLIRNAWAAVGHLGRAKSLRFALRGNAAAQVDAERVQQVLINLLDNAVRHSPRGGTIQVELERLKGNCSIRVSDEGPGFSPEAVRNLGGAFVPGADGRAGLGLSVARLLTEAHGGSLAIGRASRHGARVEVRFPAASEKQVTI